MGGQGEWACEVVLWMEGWIHLGNLASSTHSIVVTLDVQTIQLIFADYSQSMRYPCNFAQIFARHFLDLHTRRRDSINDDEDEINLSMGQGDARSSGVDVDEVSNQVFDRGFLRLRTRSF